MYQIYKITSNPVVDFAADFIRPDGSVNHTLFWDGLHPNARGHRLMADRMIQALQPVAATK